MAEFVFEWPQLVDFSVTVVVFAITDLFVFSCPCAIDACFVSFALVDPLDTRGLACDRGFAEFIFPGVVDHAVAVVVFSITDLFDDLGSVTRAEFAVGTELLSFVTVVFTGDTEGVIFLCVWCVVDEAITVIIFTVTRFLCFGATLTGLPAPSRARLCPTLTTITLERFIDLSITVVVDVVARLYFCFAHTRAPFSEAAGLDTIAAIVFARSFESVGLLISWDIVDKSVTIIILVVTDLFGGGGIWCTRSPLAVRTVLVRCTATKWTGLKQRFITPFDVVDLSVTVIVETVADFRVGGLCRDLLQGLVEVCQC